MKASLLLRDPVGEGSRLSITGDTLLIGRNDDNDLVLRSPRVSRYHARIFWKDAEYRLEDLASTNGTWHNGARVTQSAPLKHGDTVQVGDVVLVYEVEGAQTLNMTTPAAKRPDSLTRRETEVLDLIARGLSNQEIAADLVLSVRTVERHVSSIYAKIGAKNRAEATRYALRRPVT